MPGEIVAIWIKRFKRGPMDPAREAELVAGRGIKGNANQGGKRQVTILEESRWNEATAEVGVDVDPSKRRANVFVRGIDLAQSRGRMLRLGACLIRINGETRPCERMDEAQPGLRRALESPWRGGVYGEIVEGGEISIGDAVEWAD